MHSGHDWQETDDLAAFYLYRCPSRRWSLDDLSDALNIERGAMRMRVSNHRSLDTGRGLGNASNKSKRVFTAFGSMTCDELESELLRRVRVLADSASSPNSPRAEE